MDNVLLLVCSLSFIAAAYSQQACTKFPSEVTACDKRAIINKHNALRTLISQGRVPGQPKGINLKTLKWDDRLAREAQKIANTCKFKHVKVNDTRFAVGQNLALSSSSSKDLPTNWKGTIQAWFNEHKNFVYPSTSNGVTGHYTQVVWAATYLVGCGLSWYQKGNEYQKFYACNYGPAGNVVGRAPYKT